MRAQAVRPQSARRGKRAIALSGTGPAPGRSRGARVPFAPAGRLPAGGMIAIGGPPLGGKSVIAARLADCLPSVMRLEAIDDLSRSRPYRLGDDFTSETSSTTARLLERADWIWKHRRADRPPLLLLVTRFASATERRRAKLRALIAGMPFLFVEARSSDRDALLRIPMQVLSRRQIELRLARYDAALSTYAPVARREEIALPALRLQRVLADLDAAVERVVEAWRIA